MEIKIGDGHFFYKPKRDGHPIKKGKNEIKISRYNTFHIANIIKNI